VDEQRSNWGAQKGFSHATGGGPTPLKKPAFHWDGWAESEVVKPSHRRVWKKKVKGKKYNSFGSCRKRRRGSLTR